MDKDNGYVENLVINPIIFPQIFKQQGGELFGVASIFVLILPFVVLVVTLVLGGSPELFFEMPSIVFVIVGTFTAGLSSLPFDVVKRVLPPISKAVIDKRVNMMDFIDFLSELSIHFRKDGLFGLERVVNSKKVPYPGIKRAVQLAMEMSDTKKIKEVLDIERKTYLEDIDNAIHLMELLGTYAPAFGLLGTVIGLVYMLSNLKDPSTIGQGLALALLTTFYGLVISNMIFTPLTSRLRYLRSREEILLNLTEKAILFMLDGLSPRVIKDSLIESLMGRRNTKVFRIEKNSSD